MAQGAPASHTSGDVSVVQENTAISTEVSVCLQDPAVVVRGSRAKTCRFAPEEGIFVTAVEEPAAAPSDQPEFAVFEHLKENCISRYVKSIWQLVCGRQEKINNSDRH